ncbi:MAG: hypothetical protein CBB68_14695 [Rhodospirillaceae bacterium TMED8]|nr:hypothetical protein [Magnetovibrio sp.]OUT47680.1 MAG: hypothetical protein CBB68_14695 [Rhodospirillaceae bacterium TMED8]
MARNFKTQLAGQIGEHLVVAELGRQGIVATPFAGNVPDIDILAYKDGNSVPIQVKAQTKGTPGVNAKKYLNIQIDGNRQTVKGKSKDIDRDLIFVMVKVGQDYGEDEFYVFDQGVVQDLVNIQYRSFLRKHGGVRPRNPKTTHCSYYLKDLIRYRDNWDLVFERLRGKWG